MAKEGEGKGRLRQLGACVGCVDLLEILKSRFFFFFLREYDWLNIGKGLSQPHSHGLCIKQQLETGLGRSQHIASGSAAAAAAAKSHQSCLTLCDPIDGSPTGSPVPGILQAGTLEWVAISFSSAWKWKVKVKSLSHVWLLATPWTAAHQAPASMGFSRQEYWSGVPLPSPASGSSHHHLGDGLWSQTWVGIASSSMVFGTFCVLFSLSFLMCRIQ